jgi:hypothetical protein
MLLMARTFLLWRRVEKWRPWKKRFIQVSSKRPHFDKLQNNSNQNNDNLSFVELIGIFQTSCPICCEFLKARYQNHENYNICCLFADILHLEQKGKHNCKNPYLQHFLLLLNIVSKFWKLIHHTENIFMIQNIYLIKSFHYNIFFT